MIQTFASRITRQLTKSQSIMFSSSSEEGSSFLKMVDSYFDKAGIHTGIRSDYLNFYKKPDNVVKCSIPLVRGTCWLNQKMERSKRFLPSDANIKLINSQQKVEQDMLKTLTSKK